MGVLGGYFQGQSALGSFLGAFGPNPCTDGWRAQGGVKSCAELLLGLVMEHERFPALVVPRQAGTHCLHPGSGGMGANAQVPHCARLHGLSWAAPWGAESASHANGNFCKASMHLLNKQQLGHCLWRAVQCSSHFSCDTSFFQNISWSWAPSSGCGNVQVWICSVWAGLSPVV